MALRPSTVSKFEMHVVATGEDTSATLLWPLNELPTPLSAQDRSGQCADRGNSKFIRSLREFYATTELTFHVRTAVPVTAKDL